MTKPGRGRKRKTEDGAAPSGASKRMRNAPPTTSAHDADQGHSGPVKLEAGATHWESEDELPPQIGISKVRLLSFLMLTRC